MKTSTVVVGISFLILVGLTVFLSMNYSTTNIDGFLVYDDFSDGVLEFMNNLVVNSTPNAAYYDYHFFGEDEKWIINYTDLGLFNQFYWTLNNIYKLVPVTGLTNQYDFWITQVLTANLYSGNACNPYEQYLEPEILIKKDFRGYEIKLLVNGAYEIYLGNTLIAKKTAGQIYQRDISDDTIIVYPSFLEKDKVFVYIDEILVGDFVISDKEWKLKFINKDAVYCLQYLETRTLIIYPLKIKNVKYREPYFCDVEDNEVVVIDTFVEGSKVSIDTLRSGSFENIKFCLEEYPVRERSYIADGVKVDERGEVLQAIVRGETLTVPTSMTWDVMYIAEYGNTTYRCPEGSGWSTVENTCLAIAEVCWAHDIFNVSQCVDFINTNDPGVGVATGVTGGGGGGGGGSPKKVVPEEIEEEPEDEKISDDPLKYPILNNKFVPYVVGGIIVVIIGGLIWFIRKKWWGRK